MYAKTQEQGVLAGSWMCTGQPEAQLGPGSTHIMPDELSRCGGGECSGRKSGGGPMGRAVQQGGDDRIRHLGWILTPILGSLTPTQGARICVACYE